MARRISKSISFDEFTDELLNRMARKTGLPRSVLLRRLLVAYASNTPTADLLPIVHDRGAERAVVEMTL